MAVSTLRYKRLLDELPKNNFNVSKSAIKAGFSPKTADKQGKKLVHNAMKYEARELAERLEGSPTLSKKEAKQTMSELVGLTREDVMKRLEYIASQTKDLHSALKVLAPLAKEHGVILQEEDTNKTIVPILNVTVKEKTHTITAQQSHEKEIDPPLC